MIETIKDKEEAIIKIKYLIKLQNYLLMKFFE